MGFYRDIPDEGFEEKAAVCVVCSRRPVAYWAGQVLWFVCYDCAVEVLPKLIADAVVDRWRFERPQRAAMAVREWKRVEANFWYAVSHALERTDPPEGRLMFLAKQRRS